MEDIVRATGARGTNKRAFGPLSKGCWRSVKNKHTTREREEGEGTRGRDQGEGIEPGPGYGDGERGDAALRQGREEQPARGS